MCSVRVLIYFNGSLWEQLFIFLDQIRNNASIKPKERNEFSHGDFDNNGFEIVEHHDIVSFPEGDQAAKEKNVKFHLAFHSLEFSYVMHALKCSRQYRLQVIDYWCKRARKYFPNIKKLTLNVSLFDPPQQAIDHTWCHRINGLVLGRSELDNAMSWLSTLGGAYSALGDESTHCAQMAGRISVRQFQLALHLGDPTTVARCKLYVALSLIQTNRFHLAKELIKAQYNMAVNTPCPDIRLVRMCRGVWSKLRYEHSRYLKKKSTFQK